MHEKETSQNPHQINITEDAVDEIENDVRKFIRGNTLFFLFILSIPLSIVFVLYALARNVILSVSIESVYLWTGIGAAFLLPLKEYLNNRKTLKYSLPDKMVPHSEGFSFTTYGKWESSARYSDFMAIFDRETQVERGTLSQMPASIVYYYDRKLRNVNSLMFESSAFYAILQRYRKHLEKTGKIKPALVICNKQTLIEVESAKRKGNLDELLEEFRSNGKLKEFE